MFVIKIFISILLVLSLISLSSCNIIFGGENNQIGDRILEGNWYYTVNIDTVTITIVEYVGVATNVTIPEELDGKTVTKIQNDVEDMPVFSSELNRVIIPDSILEIGENAFSGCNDLESIYLLSEEFPLAAPTAFDGVVAEVLKPNRGNVSNSWYGLSVNVFESLINYTVLVVDVSGSMKGESGESISPIRALRLAVQKFCETTLQSSSLEHYIAIVPYNGSVSEENIVKFTKDYEELASFAENLRADGGTNIEAGLIVADELLDPVPNNSYTFRNIILMTDGLPDHGDPSDYGPYTPEDYKNHRQANAVYNKAEEIKFKGYNIYTLAFLHSLVVFNELKHDLKFVQVFLKDLQNSGYYEIKEPKDFIFRFIS